jgi:hypothetical protein
VLQSSPSSLRWAISSGSFGLSSDTRNGSNSLIQGTDLERDWGRPRHGGIWALAFLAFVVVSGRSDVEPWWASTDEAFWAECGFSLKPCYQTVWN